MLKTSKLKLFTATRGQPTSMNKALNASKSFALHTLFACTGQGKNTYTQASIDKILELLSDFHKINIQHRWLFQCLRDLEQLGYINRQIRYSPPVAGQIRQIPSLWSFTPKRTKENFNNV